MATNGSNYLQRAPSPSGLADVLNVILDKGIVIDAFVRISAVGIELVTLDARITIASIDTYLRFAEAVNRLDLTKTEVEGLQGLEEVAARDITEHEIGKAEEEAGSVLRGAAKGVAAGAAVAGAAVVAKHLIEGRSEDEDEGEE